MREVLLALLCLPFLLARVQAAESLFKIPANAAQELPAGVPRVVDTNGCVIHIDGMFTTKAYQQENLRLLVAEANKVARELQLPEVLPIAASNLTRAFIGTFGYNYLLRGLGNVTTSNYSYGVERDYKFSDLALANLDEMCCQYSKEYQWPLSRLDTNAAYQLATQWLAAAHMDVEGLNRDCVVHVVLDPHWNGVRLGEIPKHTFTPIYYLWWAPKGGKTETGGAEVELFLPTKTLLQLRVDDPKYILRAPLVFTNLAALFPGKATIKTNWPVKREVITPR